MDESLPTYMATYEHTQHTVGMKIIDSEGLYADNRVMGELKTPAKATRKRARATSAANKPATTAASRTKPAVSKKTVVAGTPHSNKTVMAKKAGAGAQAKKAGTGALARTRSTKATGSARTTKAMGSSTRTTAGRNSPKTTGSTRNTPKG